jgi:hypothetical protein
LQWPLYCVPIIDIQYKTCTDGSSAKDHPNNRCPEDVVRDPATQCSDGSYPEDNPGGKCPPGETKCPNGYRYDTTLENLPGVNPCVPDDGCDSGQERSPVDNQCYKRGEGPAYDRNDQDYEADIFLCRLSGGTFDYMTNTCIPAGFCLNPDGSIEPEGPNGCGGSDSDPYAFDVIRRAKGGAINDPELASTSTNPLGELKMFGIPEMPKGLGSEDIRMMKIDPRYMASGGTVKKTKKYQAGGIASLPARDPRLGGAVNPAEGYNFGFAQGGMPSMPEYQAGGKLLRGPGDGMSDDIPAVIRGKGVQRAALADGEFVIPADVVSHLGNGSTEAGAKKLYKMMEQIRRARTGTGKQAPQVNPDKFLPRATPAKKRRRG